MASAVNATAQEARLSIPTLTVAGRTGPPIVSVASIPAIACRARRSPSTAERAPQGCIVAGSALSSDVSPPYDRRPLPLLEVGRYGMPQFEKRRIGRTSLEVTLLGLGCATLGATRIPLTRQGAEAIVRAAWDAGVRYVDAARYYGFCQAERAV